jgi:SAM-dependent methyltransferase
MSVLTPSAERSRVLQSTTRLSNLYVRLSSPADLSEALPVADIPLDRNHGRHVNHEGLARATGMAKNGSGEWDERYSSAVQLWSGRPNAALVTEVAELEPGRALDVGCGEGADAVWLAKQGWDVTALDVSQVALERAALHARDGGAHVQWVHAGLVDAPLPTRGFDLVSAQYPALLRSPDNRAERSLLDAVAPGGVLLFVHHADIDVEHAKAHGFDPDDYVSPSNVAALLGDDWRVEVDERRPRDTPAGSEGQHTHDIVLRARRRR